jgi:hypothetical protein
MLVGLDHIQLVSLLFIVYNRFDHRRAAQRDLDPLSAVPRMQAPITRIPCPGKLHSRALTHAMVLTVEVLHRGWEAWVVLGEPVTATGTPARNPKLATWR